VRLQSTACKPASSDSWAIYQILLQGKFAGAYSVSSPIVAPSAGAFVKTDGSVFHVDGLLQGASCAKSRHFRQAFTRHILCFLHRFLLLASTRKAGHRFAIAKLGKKLVSEDEPRVSSTLVGGEAFGATEAVSGQAT
jgi:hypothetical protein